jgi:hypothetical protein
MDFQMPNIFLTLIISSSLGFSGCSFFKLGPGPGDVAKKFTESQMNLDAATVVNLLDEKTRGSVKGSIEQGYANIGPVDKGFSMYKVKHSLVEIVDSEISGSSATVHVKVTQPGGFMFGLTQMAIGLAPQQNRKRKTPEAIFTELEKATRGQPSMDTTVTTLKLVKENGDWKVANFQSLF